jgi:hypothetical protein
MKEETYKKALQAIESVIEGETDLISVMSLSACHLKNHVSEPGLTHC